MGLDISVYSTKEYQALNYDYSDVDSGKLTNVGYWRWHYELKRWFNERYKARYGIALYNTFYQLIDLEDILELEKTIKHDVSVLTGRQLYVDPGDMENWLDTDIKFLQDAKASIAAGNTLYFIYCQ